MNTWLSFIRWLETRLQTIANVAPSQLDEQIDDCLATYTLCQLYKVIICQTAFKDAPKKRENSVQLTEHKNSVCVCLLDWPCSYKCVHGKSVRVYMCMQLWAAQSSITFHTKLTLEKVSQSSWLLQQVKVMYPALAYCRLLIALCSSRPIDFMVSQGLLRLIRLNSRVFAFSQPFSLRLSSCGMTSLTML